METSPQGRSVSYPSIDLAEAINAAQQLKTNSGSGPYSREIVANGLGYKSISGASVSKIAALSYFGLIEKIKNGNYVVTDLTTRIAIPLSEEDKQQAIIEAVKMPRLYSGLIEKFQNQDLPTQLPAILVHQHGITEAAAKNVASDFKKSIEYAGLLKNGKVQTGQSEVLPTGTNPLQNPLGDSEAQRKVQFHQDDFVFEFKGGIKLVIPKTTLTSEAIADGELKAARAALANFADQFMQPINSDTEESSQ